MVFEKKPMKNILITDDSKHRKRWYGMHTQARLHDQFDDDSLRSKKGRQAYWDHQAQPYKKLLKDMDHAYGTEVLSIDAKSNIVHLSNGNEIHYKYLVVATGANEDYEAVEGLQDAITTNDPQGLRVGHALGNPVYWYKRAWHINSGLDSKLHGDLPYVSYSPSGQFVGNDFFYPSLSMAENNMVSRHAGEIDPRTQTLDFRHSLNGLQNFHNLEACNKVIQAHNDFLNVQNHWDWRLTKVDYKTQLATFSKGSETKEVNYRYLMVSPPCKPAKFIAESGLADSEGHLTVDPSTLQHTEHSNIFGLGQCTDIHRYGTFNSLMGMAYQADVVSNNAFKFLSGSEDPMAYYNGWNASPILLSKTESIIAETTYGWKSGNTLVPGCNQTAAGVKGLELIHMLNNNYEKFMTEGNYSGGWSYGPMNRNYNATEYTKYNAL